MLLFAGAAAIVAIWWGAISHSSNPSTRVVIARIELRGAACRSHFAECAALVNHGTVVIYGPDAPDQSRSPEHTVRLNGYTTTMRIALVPGRYHFAFVVHPPYSILLPDFGGDGSFDVGESPVHLGVIRPSATWQVVGD